MGDQWRVSNGASEFIAKDFKELEVWVREGRIRGEHQVYHPKQKTWVSVSSLPELQPALAAAPPARTGPGRRAITITTGDLKRPYEVIDVVFAFVAKDTPAFGQINFPAVYAEAAALLERNAGVLRANAVVWAQFRPEWAGHIGGFGVYATGTAVQFTE